MTDDEWPAAYTNSGRKAMYRVSPVHSPINNYVLATVSFFASVRNDGSVGQSSKPSGALSGRRTGAVAAGRAESSGHAYRSSSQCIGVSRQSLYHGATGRHGRPGMANSKPPVRLSWRQHHRGSVYSKINLRVVGLIESTLTSIECVDYSHQPISPSVLYNKQRIQRLTSRRMPGMRK